LESDRIAHKATQLDLHLFTDTFSYTHCRHSPGLCTPNHSEFGIPLLVEKLCQLRCLSRASLTNHNDDLIVSDDLHKSFPDCKSGQKLSLFPERLALAEVAG